MSAATTENAFMANLFAGLDASIFSEGPSPDKSKPPSSQSPTTKRKASKNSRSSSRAEPAYLPVQLSQSPSPRKKKARCKPSGSQTRRENAKTEEIRAATELLFQGGDDWIHDLHSPSPEIGRPVVEGQHPYKQPVEEEDVRYTRCVVKEVSEGHYVPQQYQTAPPGRYTTTGVEARTVVSATQRRQKVVYICELKKIGVSQERRAGKEREGERRRVILRDEWFNTPACQGDVLHLIGEWKEERDEPVKRVDIDVEDPDQALWNEWDDIADDSATMIPTMTLASRTQSVDRGPGHCSELDNLLVLHPDDLLSATAVSTVIRCARKSYLQSTVKASGPMGEDGPSESLLMGRMLHEVLQSCLTGRGKEAKDNKRQGEEGVSTDSPFPAVWKGPASTNFSHAFVGRQIESQVQSSLEDIWSAGLDAETAVKKLWEAAVPFAVFAERYLMTDGQGQPKGEARAVDARSAESPLVGVKRILEVEEDIWSPMYGLKGFVDVTVEAQIVQPETGPHGKTMLMPMELKTGRSIDMIQHKAQTMLYTLMMSDRYQQPIEAGLLYYSKTSTLHIVRTVRNEVRGLMMARNELADYLSKRTDRRRTKALLPPTIDDERGCSRCYVADECMLYKRSIDGGLESSKESPLAALYDAKVDHLTQHHADFFKQWDHLLTLEENDVVRFRRELWTMTAAAREATGRCMADMVMRGGSASERAARSLNGMNDRIVIELAKADGGNVVWGGSMGVGDPVSVSIEPRMYSVAQGHILEITSRLVTVAVDRDVRSLMMRSHGKQARVRIDKEEFANGMAKVRYNLAKLFFSGRKGDEQRRRLVVDLCEPRFDQLQGGDSCLADRNDLNEDQRSAVSKVLSAQDYALIVGMPGTGKTTTVVELIRQIVARGHSVLLASYTHSAVDTICRKLSGETSVKFLRLGNSDRVHPDIHPHTLQTTGSMRELEEEVMKPNVVATTCLSISHALFAKRRFDYCIVDEASQITLPTCLGPLRYADKFVLVGDSMQLPPLVKNARAKEGGLDVSLFDRLQQAHPDARVELRDQYRMNEDIMMLSNHLIYHGRLRCGNDAVRNSGLRLPDLGNALHKLNGEAASCTLTPRCWIEQVLQTSTRALFIDTDLLSNGKEQRVGETMLENEAETEIVAQLSAAFVCAGVRLDEIGIITPYRQQIRALMRKLQGAARAERIEILTADKSQGRDKDVVLISLVRSNTSEGSSCGEEEDAGIGQLLNDAKRINVALTRARKKLIIVGSRSTLGRSNLLKRLWDLMHAQAWTMTLTDEELQSHQTTLARIWQAESQHLPPPSREAKAVVGSKSQALLRGRPVLQDVFNEAR